MTEIPACRGKVRRFKVLYLFRFWPQPHNYAFAWSLPISSLLIQNNSFHHLNAIGWQGGWGLVNIANHRSNIFCRVHQVAVVLEIQTKTTKYTWSTWCVEREKMAICLLKQTNCLEGWLTALTEFILCFNLSLIIKTRDVPLGEDVSPEYYTAHANVWIFNHPNHTRMNKVVWIQLHRVWDSFLSLSLSLDVYTTSVMTSLN